MMRVIRSGWRIVRHPAFWLPVLLALGIDAYVYANHLNPAAIGSDGWGYYLPLPAIFIHGDPYLTFLNQSPLPPDIAQYRWPDGTWQGLSVRGAGYLDKYALGTAVLQLPFFLAALIVSYFRDPPINGFETIFQVANAFSAIFYFGLGTFLIYRTLRLRNGALASTAAVAAVVLATNLTNYATNDGSFSHVYGFCVLAGVVYLTLWHVESRRLPTLMAFVLFGFLIGLAVMIRPTNAIYGLLYLLFIRGTPLRALVIGSTCAFVASAMAASPQMLLWYVTTGRPIYYSYVGEGFRFRSPALIGYLISIRKGVFFWHPVYLLMVLALLRQFSYRRFEAIISLTIVLLGLYIGSSWGDFSFGDSFGSRHSIELLPILAVPFADAISSLLVSRRKWIVTSVMVPLIALNTVYFWGYINHLLPRNDASRTNYLHFWRVTLNLSK